MAAHPPNARVRWLKAIPAQAADLSFEVDGVIGQAAAQLQLGVAIGAAGPLISFDLATFYANLGTTVLISGVPATLTVPAGLQYDSQGILTDPSVQASLLFALRAEAIKAVLDKAVAARVNLYFQKYWNQTNIISQMRAAYSASVANSKPNRLTQLARVSTAQAAMLDTAYGANSRLGVVLATNTNSNSNAVATSSQTTYGASNTASGQTTTTKAATDPGNSDIGSVQHCGLGGGDTS